MSAEPPAWQESILTWLVPWKFDLCLLQPLSSVLVEGKSVRGREYDRDIKFRRYPVHKLEFLRMDHEDLGESRKSGPPTKPR